MSKIVKTILMLLVIIGTITSICLTYKEATKSNDNSTEIRENNNSNMMERKEIKSNSLDIKYYILFIAEGLVLGASVIYLIMSKINSKSLKETFITQDKVLIYILSILVISIALTIVCGIFVTKNNKTDNRFEMKEENKEKETSAEDVDSGKEVTDSKIDLSNYTSNITITKSGEYTLTGSFKYSVIVNADSDVILNLDGVNIESTTTSAIANGSKNKLTINILEGTTNILKDGGSSEYDGCIFSYGELVIDGTGTLKIYGLQEEGEGIATKSQPITINNGNIYVESNDDGLNAGGDGGTITVNGGTVFIKASGDGIDSNKDFIVNGGTVYTMGSSKGGDAGIDTDDGYSINGGLVVALGSDMLEVPTSSSKQYSICLELSSSISSGTLITLLNNDDEVITSFEAKEDFKTLIISSDKIKNGTYYLYTGGSNSGNSTNGIYDNSKYTKGNLLKEIKVTSSITKVN